MTPTISDVVKILEELVPPKLAEDWDNVGLMLGRMDHPVKRIMFALDFTAEVLEQAIKKNIDLIITHHPAIFKKLTAIRDDEWQSDLLISAAERGIAVYSAHTNLDCVGTGVNHVLARRLLLEDVDVLDDSNGLGRIGIFPTAMSLEEFAALVKKRLKADYVVIGNAGKKVHRVAVCGGAGSDLIDLALAKGADTLVTGDVKYHSAQRAVFSGLNIVDAGHQSTELPVLEQFADRLGSYLAAGEYDVMITIARETLLLKQI